MSGARSASRRTAIRHVACPLERKAPWFAVGEWEREVEVWSLAERRLVSSFETVLDPGGRRLGLLGGEQPIVVAGAYHRHGVCAYDALTGERLWQRKELKRVQGVHPLPGRRVAAGFDDGSLHLLAGETGETLTKIRGLASLYAWEGCGVGLGAGHSGSGWVGLYELETGKRLWKEGLSSFAILHAALGPESVAISEGGGAVRCLDYDGIERWRWSPPAGEHVRRLAWSEPLERFCGVLDSYEAPGSRQALLAFDGRGAVEEAAALAEATEYEFTAAGDALVVATLDEAKRSAGEVVAIDGARVVWRFREPVPL